MLDARHLLVVEHSGVHLVSELASAAALAAALS